LIFAIPALLGSEQAHNIHVRRNEWKSVLQSMRIRVRVWLEQRSKRRECIRRHRLMMHAERRLR
jgi:hypothetical protein